MLVGCWRDPRDQAGATPVLSRAEGQRSLPIQMGHPKAMQQMTIRQDLTAITGEHRCVSDSKLGTWKIPTDHCKVGITGVKQGSNEVHWSISSTVEIAACPNTNAVQFSRLSNWLPFADLWVADVCFCYKISFAKRMFMTRYDQKVLPKKSAVAMATYNLPIWGSLAQAHPVRSFGHLAPTVADSPGQQLLPWCGFEA